MSRLRKTTEQFIEDARKVHGDVYDYRNSVYVGAREKIEINCPKHGPFTQQATSHLGGVGCPKCWEAKRGLSRRKNSLSNFLKKAQEIHGNKYDYSRVKLTMITAKIEILCRDHGSFFQPANAHLDGRGCHKCARKGVGSSDTLAFIKKAREIHGDLYDYSSVDYMLASEKVIVKCKVHGDFLITPNKHLNGQGCRLCVNMFRTTEEYVAEARRIHGNKFDYSKAQWSGTNSKINITCPKHGEFRVKAGRHLSTQGGCMGCRKELLVKKFSLSLEEFISKSRSVHGDRYNYSLVEYQSVKDRVKIICPEHGVFEQSGQSHYDLGCGCPECAETGYSSLKDAWFYLMERPGEQQIGITNDPDTRLSAHRRNGWNLIEIVGPFDGGDVFAVEKTFKAWLKNDVGRVQGTHENWLTANLEVQSLKQLKEIAGIKTCLF